MCAADVHVAWSFVRHVSENITGATKGEEEGIWEPRYGGTLVKKSLNTAGKKMTERAEVKSSTFRNRSDSGERVDAASHN